MTWVGVHFDGRGGLVSEHVVSVVVVTISWMVTRSGVFVPLRYWPTNRVYTCAAVSLSLC